MPRNSHLRYPALLCVLMLLFSCATVQAAGAPPIPPPQRPTTQYYLESPPVPSLLNSGPTYGPDSPRRAQPQQQPARTKAAPARTAAPAPEPVRTTTVDPEPVRPAPKSGASGLLTAAQEPAATSVAVNSANWGYSDYHLSVTADVFAAGSTASTTATLTYAGQPLAGATVWIDRTTASGVTDAAGQVLLTFAADTVSDILNLKVTPPGGATAPMTLGQVFILQPGYGAMAIEGVTDRQGAYLHYYKATVSTQNGPQWTYGTAETGTAGFVLPAGDAHLEITSNGGTSSLYLYQVVPVVAGQKSLLHPSGSDTRELQVTAALDGQPVSGTIHLHNRAFPAWSPFNNFGSPVFVTPGNYDVSYSTGEGAEQVVLMQSDTPVQSDASVALSGTRSGLAHAHFSASAGSQLPEPLRSVTLHLDQTEVRLFHPVDVYLQPHLPVRVDRYHMALPDESQEYWDYWFEGTGPTLVHNTGTYASYSLGGPLNACLNQEPPAVLPGQWVSFETWLCTHSGDVAMIDHDRMVEASLELRNSSDQVLFQQSVMANHAYTGVQLPGEADTYRVLLSLSAGPYQTSVSNEFTVQQGTAPTEDPYELTLSDDWLAPGEDAIITARLTYNGVPVEGAQLEVGWGGYPGAVTDSNGEALIHLHARDHRDAIPISVVSPFYVQQLAYIYVVPDGYGVVTVRSVTGAHGNAMERERVALSTYWPDGGWDMHSGGKDPQGVFGSVRPAGTTHLEFAGTDQTGTGLFLYQTLEVAAGQRYLLDLTAEGTNLLAATASLDGAEVGGDLYLHNQAKGHPSLYNGWLPQTTYATPGIYTAVLMSEGSDVVLTERHADLTGDTAVVTMNATTSGLSWLDAKALTGTGADAWIERAKLVVGGEVGIDLRYGKTYGATPGIPYRMNDYALRALSSPDWPDLSWRYDFLPGKAQAFTPVPGQTESLGLGGPVALQITSMTDPVAGEPYQFSIGLFNTQGYHLSPWPAQPGPVATTAKLVDEHGNVAFTANLSGPNYSVGFRLPSTPGSYTLVVDTPDIGPYQGALHAELALELAAPAPAVQLAVSPALIPAGVPTDVTVRATRDGQPVAGLMVDVGWGRYTGTTDANGEATFTVHVPYSFVYAVGARDAAGQRLLPEANLFIAGPGLAAIEVTGNDAQGNPLTEYHASAETAWGSWSTWADWRPAGLLVTAGPAYVDLTAYGSPAYVLHTQIEAEEGIINRVHFDGRTAVFTDIAATLDGEILQNGELMVRPTGKRALTDLSALYLDGAGQGRLYHTPGLYTFMLRGRTAGGENLLATLPEQELQGGAQSLTVSGPTLGRLDMSAVLAGVPQKATAYLDDGRFWTATALPQAVLASAGQYRVGSMDLFLPQPSGERWQYELYPRQHAAYSLAAGQTLPLTWDLAMAEPQVWLRSDTYSEGGGIEYSLMTETVSGWGIGWVWNNTAPNWGPRGNVVTQITDHEGRHVFSADSDSPHTNYFSVPSVASPSYTITMSRDLGLLGSHTASATATLAQPPTLYVDREWIPTGQTTALKVIVRDGIRPAANAWVFAEGEGREREWVRTNRHGQATLPIKPTRSGTWRIGVTTGYDKPWTYGELYALAPGDGLVDVEAVDRNGQPLTYYSFTAVNGGASAYRTPSEHPRLILKAGGPQPIVVRGAGSNGEGYYLVQDVVVPDQGSITVRADGALALPLTVDLAHGENSTYTSIVLRNTAYDYQESMPLQLGQGTFYATPGMYEALLVSREGGMRRMVYAPPFPLHGPYVLHLDLDAATAEIAVTATNASGTQQATGYAALLGTEYLGIFPFLWPGQRLFITPGTFQHKASYLSFDNLHPNQSWSYMFEGKGRPFKATAGAAVPLPLGGALQAVINPGGTVVTPGATVPVAAYARDANGHALLAVQGQVGSGTVTLSAALTITGPNNYSWSTEFTDTQVLWQAPLTTGTYAAGFLFDVGPYGAPVTGTGSINVIRVPRRP